MFVLSLSNESVYSEEIPSAAVSVPSSGASYLIASENHGFMPVIVFCDITSCSSFYITDDSENRVRLLSDCGGVGSVTGQERIPFGGSLGAAVLCAQITDKKKIKMGDNVCVNKDVCTAQELKNVITVTSSRIIGNEVRQSNFDIVLTDKSSSSPLLYVSTSSKGDKHTALTVQSNLLTTFYTSIISDINVNAVEVWRREECLSQVKQTVIADDARSHVHVDGVDDVAPNFTERLTLQYEELKVMLLYVIYLFVGMFIYISFHPSICSSIYLPIVYNLNTYLFIFLSTHLFIYLFILLSTAHMPI